MASPQDVVKYANKHTAITTGYTNYTNAYTADTPASYATAAPAKQAEISAYWGFPAFTTGDIPDNSTINSVTVELKFKVDTTASIANQYIQVFVNTTGQGSEAGNTSEPATDTALSHQVTSGVTLANLRTADIVRARTRSARGNSNTAVTFSIEYVKVTVNFTPPDTPPTTVLGTPADTATGVSITPDLKMTATDADGQAVEYQVQIDTANTFDSGSTPNQTVASLPTTNRDDYFILSNVAGERQKIGQTFKPSLTCILTKAQLFLLKTGSPTGNAVVKLYNHTGTFGNGGVPTGTALDTSSALDVSTVDGAAYTLYDFNFTGGISLTAGTAYCVAIEYAGGSAGNNIRVGIDFTSSTYEGNEIAMMSGDTAWGSDGDYDCIFYIIGTTGGPLQNIRSDVETTGWTAGHPFTSAVEVTYTVQTNLSNNTLYYWRARAKDPTGTNTYGNWATTKSFTTVAAGGGLQHIKSINGILLANIKTMGSIAKANIKSINGIN